MFKRISLDRTASLPPAVQADVDKALAQVTKKWPSVKFSVDWSEPHKSVSIHLGWDWHKKRETDEVGRFIGSIFDHNYRRKTGWDVGVEA